MTIPAHRRPGSSLSPPLKWAGGKRWLVPRLAALYAPHRHRRLVDPFVGGMAIALGLVPDRALLMDINPHAISFYQWLQRGLTIDFPMENCSECFYSARDRFNSLVSSGYGDSAEAAGLFYYLNRTCYNGLCRFNRSGGFNTPFGRYRTINYTRDFTLYRDLLATWEIRCGDFEQVAPDPDDFIYTDPPYDVEFRQYSAGGFSWGEQERLAGWLSRHPGPVVASNQATERILDLYTGLGFKIETAHAPRLISCTGDRRPALEMIASRNL